MSRETSRTSVTGIVEITEHSSVHKSLNTYLVELQTICLNCFAWQREVFGAVLVWSGFFESNSSGNGLQLYNPFTNKLRQSNIALKYDKCNVYT